MNVPTAPCSTARRVSVGVYPVHDVHRSSRLSIDKDYCKTASNKASAVLPCSRPFELGTSADSNCTCTCQYGAQSGSNGCTLVNAFVCNETTSVCKNTALATSFCQYSSQIYNSNAGTCDGAFRTPLSIHPHRILL